jgi:hypothetical protein
MQASESQSPVDCIASQSTPQQLATAHNPVLALRQSNDPVFDLPADFTRLL